MVPNPVQCIPSCDVAMVFVPYPTATHIEPFHAIPFPNPVKIVLPLLVQKTPSGEVAIEVLVLTPCPTATHNLPFHAISITLVNKVVPNPVQFIASVELTIVFIPSYCILPPATIKLPGIFI